MTRAIGTDQDLRTERTHRDAVRRDVRRHRQEHGRTAAAWTTVTIIVVGCLVSALGVISAQPPLFVIGLAVVALGLAVGKVMSMAGLGKLPGYSTTAPPATSLEGPTRTQGQKDVDAMRE